MYRTLDTEKTIQTLRTLANRIGERFPQAGLQCVCRELVVLAEETRGRIEKMARPNAGIRAGISVVVVAAIAVLGLMLRTVRLRTESYEIAEFVQMLEAGTNVIVLMGAALFFLITLESRLKRAKALKSLHELRAISHVIDMHQLTKDPSQTLGGDVQRTASSPARTLTPFQLLRYLDYCSEMLALIGKLAALYPQTISDQVVLQNVNDIETLTNGLSRKIWQKIMILEEELRRAALDPARDGQTPHGSPAGVPAAPQLSAVVAPASGASGPTVS